MDAVYTHAIETQKPFLKDPGSAITHFIGAVASVFGAVPLLVKAHRTGDPACIVSMTVFISSMILLYTASTVYHSFDISVRVNRILQKLDHDFPSYCRFLHTALYGNAP